MFRYTASIFKGLLHKDSSVIVVLTVSASLNDVMPVSSIVFPDFFLFCEKRYKCEHSMLSLVEPSRPSLVSDLLSLSALPNAIAPLSRILLPVYRKRMKGCVVDKHEPVYSFILFHSKDKASSVFGLSSMLGLTR